MKGISDQHHCQIYIGTVVPEQSIRFNSSVGPLIRCLSFIFCYKSITSCIDKSAKGIQHCLYADDTAIKSFNQRTQAYGIKIMT